MTTTTTLTYATFWQVLPQPEGRLAWLHRHFGRKLARLIKQVTGGLLPRPDMQDAYQEAVQAFWQMLCRQDLSPKRYIPVLRRIAIHKAVDAMRRHGMAPATNAWNLLCLLVDDSQVDLEMLTPDEVWEFRQTLVRVLAELPDRQRLVAEVYLNHCEEFDPRAIHERLTELVSAVTGQPERLETIKSLWHAARKKIGAALRRLGYTLEGS
jgi:DNA-directed RNA polymerase specialized sigma24 family protein